MQQEDWDPPCPPPLAAPLDVWYARALERVSHDTTTCATRWVVWCCQTYVIRDAVWYGMLCERATNDFDSKSATWPDLLSLGHIFHVHGYNQNTVVQWQSTIIRHQLNGFLAQWVPSLFLASSFRKCLNCAVLKCMFPWMSRYPLS